MCVGSKKSLHLYTIGVETFCFIVVGGHTFYVKWTTLKKLFRVKGDRPNDRRGDNKDMQYSDYLKSSDWKHKRFLKRKKKQNCAICNSKENLDTHHLNYRNLFGVKQSDLRILCRDCHFLAHKLMKQGKIKFTTDNHHSRFTILKAGVKKAKGLSTTNMFIKV